MQGWRYVSQRWSSPNPNKWNQNYVGSCTEVYFYWGCNILNKAVFHTCSSMRHCYRYIKSLLSCVSGLIHPCLWFHLSTWDVWAEGKIEANQCPFSEALDMGNIPQAVRKLGEPFSGVFDNLCWTRSYSLYKAGLLHITIKEHVKVMIIWTMLCLRECCRFLFSIISPKRKSVKYLLV